MSGRQRAPVPEELAMSVGEAMFTQRATRRLKPDPIADAHLRLVLSAATKAPSGANTQPARFLVVRDDAARRRFGELYYEAWWAKRRDHQGWKTKADIPADDTNHRLAALLADEMGTVPAIVLVVAPAGSDLGHSVYPSVQNLLLAARALGIGSVLTTLHADVMDRVHALFGIPEAWSVQCCIPLGYPRGRFGPSSRLPYEEVCFSDTWGEPISLGS